MRNANKIKINLEVAIIETKFDTKHCLVVDMSRNCAHRAKSGGVWNLKSSYVATTGFKLCSSHWSSLWQKLPGPKCMYYTANCTWQYSLDFLPYLVYASKFYMRLNIHNRVLTGWAEMTFRNGPWIRLEMCFNSVNCRKTVWSLRFSKFVCSWTSCIEICKCEKIIF